jgi:formate dehydrogenase beta subunit
MGITRRTALQTMMAAGATAVGARPTEAAVLPMPPADAVGLLYDATLCIGCKACTVACRDANGLPADTSGLPSGLYNAPLDLSARSKTVIKLYADGTTRSYVKAQCMHCVDPACVSACMLGALKKREFGIVSYDVDLCIGCRYCEVGCPFGVPKFEFAKAAPRIVKCELCKERLAAGQEPACTDVCPRQAVIFGKRTELLKEAKRRIADNPGRYVPRVYGETDGGGTQVLYLSHVPFDKLGLPTLGDEPAPQLARSIQHGVYRGLIAPAALYAALGIVMLRNRRHDDSSR